MRTGQIRAGTDDSGAIPIAVVAVIFAVVAAVVLILMFTGERTEPEDELPEEIQDVDQSEEALVGR